MTATMYKIHKQIQVLRKINMNNTHNNFLQFNQSLLTINIRWYNTKYFNLNSQTQLP